MDDDTIDWGAPDVQEALAVAAMWERSDFAVVPAQGISLRDNDKWGDMKPRHEPR